MSDVQTRIAQLIAAEINAKPQQVTAAVALLDEGATVPFVARYRKEATGGLDDGQLRELEERLGYLRELEARRKTVLDSISSQGKLTEELAAKIAGVGTKAELEDLYLPYKPKRRTRAQIAREKGLQPLADAILENRKHDPAEFAKQFLTEEVADTKAALDGARDILTETFAENADLIGKLRGHMKARAVLSAKVQKGKEEEGAKFADYFNHAENWTDIPSHRALAMLRARNEEVISLDLDVDAEDTSAVKPVERIIAGTYDIQPKRGTADAWLMDVARWAWKVKLSSSLSVDLMTHMRERAEEEAI
ncbi:MAG: Tex-like N-terminal domain-containing protein, partial [Rhodomicrobiaceae bacterium]